MRLRLWMVGIALLFASCDNGAGNQPLHAEDSFWTGPLACLLYGVIAGMVTGALLFRLTGAKPEKKAGSDDRDKEIKEARRAAKLAEQELAHREIALSAAKNECRELQRKVDELERLIRPTIAEQPMEETASDQAAAERTDRYYFLQPTTEGRFTPAGAVTREADALYELQLLPGSQEEASLSFIDTPGNVALAVQNEANWILVACERSNIATASTRSIRTEVPGRVVRKEGGWVILQKARITYQ